MVLKLTSLLGIDSNHALGPIQFLFSFAEGKSVFQEKAG